MTEEIDLGPPVFVFRDDPLLNQGYVAAELALAVLTELEPRLEAEDWSEGNAGQAKGHLEAFLEAVREEAKQRANA